VSPTEPADTARGSQARADLALLAVALIWGINIPAMKYALGYFDPLAFNAMRLTLSAIVLWWLERLERRGASPPPVPWVRVILVGLLASVGYQILFILGMANTTAGNTALIIASSPIWTAVVAGLTRTERLRRGAWLGLVLAFLGTSLVTVGPTFGESGASGVDFAGTYLAGNLLVLAAAMAWAWGTVLSKPLLQEMSPTRLAFLFTAVTLPAHFVLAAPAAAETVRADAGLGGWACVIYAGVLSTGIAYAFWNYGIRKVGPSHTAVIMNLVPLVALFLAWLALRETITPVQLGGGALLLTGLVVMRRAR